MADGKTTGIDTGTPGFDIDGQSYTYDPVEKGQPGVDPIPTNHGDINVDHTQRDISSSTKETLADFLGKKTRLNQYPIDGSASEAALSTNKGNPAPLKSTENTARFVDRSTLVRQSSFQEDPRSDFVTAVSIGQLDPQKPNGNDLLTGKAPDPAVGRYVSSILKNNRFTADAQMIGPSFDDPSKSYDPILQHPTMGDVAMSRLAQVGSILSSRASQELDSNNPGYDPSSAGAEAGALLPSANQLAATRISVNLLQARDVLTDLTTEGVAASKMLSLNDKSWGQLNNVNDQFSGFAGLGMIGLSAALTAAVLVAFEGLSALIGMISPAPPITKLPEGRYLLGQSALEKNSNPSSATGLGNLDFSAGNFVPSLLGIRPTVKPFSDAVKKGVEAYFGFDGSILGGLKQSIASPGHNVVVARMIVRSSVSVLETIKGSFKGANVVSAAENVLNITEAIRSSKFIAALNVFAQLGDQELTDNPEFLIAGSPGEPIKKSRIDSIPDGTPGFAVSKNRLNSGHTKLAWANNQTPSSYLLPTRILGMSIATKLGGFQTGYGLQESRTRSKYKLIEGGDQAANDGRIPYKDSSLDSVTVKNIETALEAEYMPFSFHDLRTNEIISFHAFLDELQETYTPAYEATSGFGRVDDVQTYKSTRRGLTMSFKLAATSEEDFNDMWVKINKFITLVYPQYTEGRTISTNGYEFVQPFSQMMGASPMIRLRLGDLIKTNYSRFALARLFGAGTKQDLKLGTADSIDFKIAQDQIEKQLEHLKHTQKSNWYIATDGVSIDGISLNLPAFGSVSKEFAKVFAVGADAIYLPVTIENYTDNNENVIISPSIITESDLVNYYGFSPSDALKKVSDLINVYSNSRAVKTRVVGAKYKVAASSLRPSPMISRTIIDSLSSTVASSDVLNALSEFMSPANNALVRSFDSIKGKGLAGFITNISINWLTEGVTWEINPGSKAPKLCSISLDFQPIHDIAPGLDHVGFNRAPIYNVGWYRPGFDDKE